MVRHELLNTLLQLFPAPRYLEIGVQTAETFRFIKAAERAAVDPMLQFDRESPDFVQPPSVFFEIPSDQYFEKHADVSRPFDVVFIDGLHTFEQTFRDFTNVLGCTSRSSIIVLDDIAPGDFVEAAHMDTYLKIRQFYPENTGWMGDVFKMLFMIETFFPSIQMRVPAEARNQLITWRTPFARPIANSVMKSVAGVAGAQFADLVLSRPHFTPRPLAQIVQEYSTQLEQTGGGDR